jgi:hypothetical protein
LITVWIEQVGEDWDEVFTELRRVFGVSRDAAKSGESFVYVVSQDDLLGRRGSGPAMVACGALSAARTAALEGAGKGWTANVVAYDDGIDRARVETLAELVAATPEISGELIRAGTGHIGKALP